MAGSHVSTQRGMGMEFRGHATLLSYPDPRRIDIRQTIRDPNEQIHVRIFNQKSATPVFAIADLSGSMNFGSRHRKIALACQIAESIAVSATRNSDPFSFIGFDDEVLENWRTTLSVRSHHALELIERLKHHHSDSKGSKGILDLYRFLPRERSLIFLISDFHMPLELIEQALPLILRHHIVPVVLWDSAEYKNLPDFGISSVVDPESGEKRTLFLRKELREKIFNRFEERRKIIHNLFMRFDMPPLFIEGDFDANVFTEYFHQFVVA